MRGIIVVCFMLATTLLVTALPSGQAAAQDLQIAGSDLAALEEPRIPVKTFRFSGSTVFSSEELQVLLADWLGQSVTFFQLEQSALVVTNYYRSHGYMLAQAYIPPQEVGESGSIEIAILEGHYDQIHIENESRLNESVARRLLRGLPPGSFVTAAPQERALLLLSDLPGIVAGSRMSAGSKVGTTDLTVHLSDGPRVAGTVELDAYGNRLTGKLRTGVSLSVHNPTGYGDQLSVGTVTTGSRLLVPRLSYSLPIGSGPRLEAAYSMTSYKLGEEFKILEAKGSSRVLSLVVRHPVRRSRLSNLHLEVGIERKSAEDRLLDLSTGKEVALINVGLSGDRQEPQGGTRRFSLRITSGNLKLVGESAIQGDALTAKSQGTFHKLVGERSSEWTLAEDMKLFGSIKAQWASKNLDSGERLPLSGPDGVRAYDADLSGDQGWLGKLELRRTFTTEWLRPGMLQASLFVDGGGVWLHKNPWTTDDNYRQIYGAGIGVSWSLFGGFTLKADQAWQLGSPGGRLWVRMAYQY